MNETATYFVIATFLAICGYFVVDHILLRIKVASMETQIAHTLNQYKSEKGTRERINSEHARIHEQFEERLRKIENHIHP